MRLMPPDQLKAKRLLLKLNTYAPDKLQKSTDLITKGESYFSKEQIKDALDIAKEAQQAAWEAEQQSYRLRTDAKQADADESIKVAETAGARLHSPQSFNQAIDARQRSTNLYTQENYHDALESAQQALELANYSRMRIISDAEKHSQSALAAEAETYSKETIDTALIALANAKTQMDNKNYTESNSSAQSALEKAKTAENTSWKLRSDDLVKRNDVLVDKLMQNKALEKVETSYAESIRVLALAKANYEVESYKSSYEKLVEAQAKLQETWEELRQVGKASIAAMKRKIDDIKNLVKDDYGNKEVSMLIDNIPKAETMLEKGELGGLFDLEMAFNQQSSISSNNIKSNNMQLMITQIQDQLNKYETSKLTLFIPEETADIRKRLGEISNKTKEMDQYDNILQSLGSIESEVKALPEVGERAITNRVTGLKRKLNQALQNEADRLVPEDYEKALIAYKEVPVDITDVDSYQELYNQISIAEGLADKASEFAQIRSKEEAYKELLKTYIIDTNALLSGFSGVTDHGYEFFLVAKPSNQVNVYRELQRDLPVAAFYKRSVLLNDKINQVQPPVTLNSLHKHVLDTFDELVKSADYFQKYGMYNRYDEVTRSGFLKNAYAHLEKLKINLQYLDQVLEEQGTKTVKRNAFSRWLRRS